MGGWEGEINEGGAGTGRVNSSPTCRVSRFVSRWHFEGDDAAGGVLGAREADVDVVVGIARVA